MVALPPVLLVLDISTLSAVAPQEWVEFSRVGSCVIPQVVYEEMRFLYDRSPDPDLERIAKSFTRFYPNSGWQISDANAHHPELKAATGQAMTKRARVSLAVARCAYGLAQTVPNSLVILVSKDRSLLQRLHQIPSRNLCGVTDDALLQWSRTGQHPISVSQKLQQFRSATPRSAVRVPPSAKSSPLRRRALFLPSWFPDIVSLLSAAIALAIAGVIGWALFSDSSLEQFLLPKHQPAQSGQ